MTDFLIKFSGKKRIIARDAEEAMDCFYQDVSVAELQIEDAEIEDEHPVEDEP